MKECKRTTFWRLPVGARFDDGVTMWSFVKIGRFTAQYFDMQSTTTFAPWARVFIL